MIRSSISLLVMAVLAVINSAPTAHSQLTDISPNAISSMKASTTTFTIGGALSGSTAVLVLKTHAYIPTSPTFPAYNCLSLPPAIARRSTENATVVASSQVTFTTAGLTPGSYTLCFHNATVPVNTTYNELMNGTVTFIVRFNETNSSMTCWNHTAANETDYNVTCNMTIEWYEERWKWVNPPTAIEEFPMYPVAIAGPIHPKRSRVDCCGKFQVGNIYSCALLTYDDLGQLAGSTEEECKMGVCVKDGQSGVIYEPLKTVPTFTKLGMFNFTFNATVSGCYGSAMGYFGDTPLNGGIAAHFKIAAGEVRGWASTAECSTNPGVPCSVINRDMWGNPVSKCGYDSTGTIKCTGTIAD